MHIPMGMESSLVILLVLFLETVMLKKQAMLTNEVKPKKRLERDIELELGDDYILDLKKNYDIPDAFKYDPIPEIWEGKNIADYIDPDIMKAIELFQVNLNATIFLSSF